MAHQDKPASERAVRQRQGALGSSQGGPGAREADALRQPPGSADADVSHGQAGRIGSTAADNPRPERVKSGDREADPGTSAGVNSSQALEDARERSGGRKPGR
jgi:hypothetical protein